MNFAMKVWNTLSDIDVSDHVKEIEGTKKRPAVPYLPWEKAWMLVKRNFPGTTYHHLKDIHHTDGTVEVEVLVDIGHRPGAMDNVPSSSRLHVMDRYMNPIQNPNAGEINKARQRALVKALAFAGLGLSLWTDDPSTPVGVLDDPISLIQAQDLLKMVQDTESNLKFLLEFADVAWPEDLDEPSEEDQLELLCKISTERFGRIHAMLTAKVRKLEAS